MSVLWVELLSARYLKTLIAGAVKADLDQCWIARLQSLPFVDFRKFDIDSAERRALIHGRVFEKEEIVGVVAVGRWWLGSNLRLTRVRCRIGCL